MSALLDVNDLVAGYGDHEILRGLTLRVEPGEIVAVIGPNGGGKSTLLKTIVLLPARRGHVRFRERDLAGVSPIAGSIKPPRRRPPLQCNVLQCCRRSRSWPPS